MVIFRLLTTISLFISLCSVTYAQNKKTINQTGSGNTHHVVQKGDSLDLEITQVGFNQKTSVLQNGSNARTTVLQEGYENRSWVMQYYSDKKSLYSPFYVPTWILNPSMRKKTMNGTTNLVQQGVKNSVIIIQNPDSLQNDRSSIEVKQSGSRNNATIIQHH